MREGDEKHKKMGEVFSPTGEIFFPDWGESFFQGGEKNRRKEGKKGMMESEGEDCKKEEKFKSSPFLFHLLTLRYGISKKI